MLLRDAPGCPSLSLTGWCQSGGMAGSPLRMTEEQVLISLRGTCYLSRFFFFSSKPSEIHICSSFFFKKENNKKSTAPSFLGPQEGTSPMWFSHFQVFGWWIRLSKNAPSPDNNTFRCRIRSVWIKTRRWMINIFSYRGRHGSFLHLNEKALSLHLYECLCLHACAFRRQELRVSSLVIVPKFHFLPFTWSTQEVLERLSCEAEVWR